MRTNHSFYKLKTLESFRFFLMYKYLEFLKDFNCLLISSNLISRATSEKGFVNEMGRLLIMMVGFQQPSLRIKKGFSLMMESIAKALQTRLKMQRFELG